MQGPIADEPRDDELRRLLDATSDGLGAGSRGPAACGPMRRSHVSPGRPTPRISSGCRSTSSSPMRDTAPGWRRRWTDPLSAGATRRGAARRRRRADRCPSKWRARSRRRCGLDACGCDALRVRDVTDLHTLESEVLRSGRQLHDANRELVALARATARRDGRARRDPHRGESRAAHSDHGDRGLQPPAARGIGGLAQREADALPRREPEELPAPQQLRREPARSRAPGRLRRPARSHRGADRPHHRRRARTARAAAARGSRRSGRRRHRTRARRARASIRRASSRC